MNYEKIIKNLRVSKLLSDLFEFTISLFVVLPLIFLFMESTIRENIYQFIGISSFWSIILYIIFTVFIFGFVSVIIEIKNQLIDLNENIAKIINNE